MEIDLNNIGETLQQLEFDDFEKLFNRHLEWSKENDRISGEPKYWRDKLSINLMGIRCNLENDFNYNKYNDWGIITATNLDETHSISYFQITTDPCRYKYGMGHMRQGCWNSYVIRPHKYQQRVFPGIGLQYRWAACQDLNRIEIIRTDGKGKMISSERLYGGFNVFHDTGGVPDSSLGCQIVKKDSSYIDLVLPSFYNIDKNHGEITDDEEINNKLISGYKGCYNCVNHANLTYTLVNYQNIQDYLK